MRCLLANAGKVWCMLCLFSLFCSLLHVVMCHCTEDSAVTATAAAGGGYDMILLSFLLNRVNRTN